MASGNFAELQGTIVQIPNVPGGGTAAGVPAILPLVAAQLNTAVGIAPTGTITGAGVLTLGTALDVIYGPTGVAPGVWLYFPATGSMPAGFYWCVMTSTTVGTVYGNGAANAPWSGQGLPPVGSSAFGASGGGAYTGATTAQVAPVFAILAGMIGPNGQVRITAAASNNGTAGAKTLSLLASAAAAMTSPATLSTQAPTTTTAQRQQGAIANLGNAAFQGAIQTPSGFGTATVAQQNLQVNTVTSNLYVSPQLTTAVATDWIILQSLLIEVLQS